MPAHADSVKIRSRKRLADTVVTSYRCRVSFVSGPTPIQAAFFKAATKER